jgi:NAD(P)H-hydrate epimerase
MSPTYFYPAARIRQADEETCAREQISSLELMERASAVFFEWFCRIKPQKVPVMVACGPGNNGGDGLAVARMLQEAGYSVEVLLFTLGKKQSADNVSNQARFNGILHTDQPNLIKKYPETTICIDALTGSGFHGKAEGILADCIRSINEQFKEIYSIDLPSGLPADEGVAEGSAVISATACLSFETPRLSLYLEDGGRYSRKRAHASIGLFTENIEKSGIYPELADLNMLSSHPIPERAIVSHKGNYGHCGILAGSAGMSGALYLSTAAALKSGAGLVSALSCKEALLPVRLQLPEAMSRECGAGDWISKIPDLSGLNVLAAGPGLGKHPETRAVLMEVLQSFRGPLILDADALNLAGREGLLSINDPSRVLITPHPGEMQGLLGQKLQGTELWNASAVFSKETGCHVLLKGAWSTLFSPDGRCRINSTGNPGMAKGGSGDVLTGLIAGLCARLGDPVQAGVIGMILHGLAGDLAAETIGMECMNSGDLIRFIPEAFRKGLSH